MYNIFTLLIQEYSHVILLNYVNIFLLRVFELILTMKKRERERERN